MNETAISWTELSWNPASGCAKVSAGCKHCYASVLAERMRGTAAFPRGFDLTIRPHKLSEPARLKKPSMIFVNSMSDLFWDQIPEAYLHRIFDVMASCPQHTFQVLTKRAEEMAEFSTIRPFPANVWAGVTVEDSRSLSRVGALRRTRARVRFVSAEPLLEPLDLDLSGIDWLIVGGESGRHLHSESPRALVTKRDGKHIPKESARAAVRGLRDASVAAGVPFFFKQWGGPRPGSGGSDLDGRIWHEYPSVLRQKALAF